MTATKANRYSQMIGHVQTLTYSRDDGYLEVTTTTGHTFRTEFSERGVDDNRSKLDISVDRTILPAFMEERSKSVPVITVNWTLVGIADSQVIGLSPVEEARDVDEAEK